MFKGSRFCAQCGANATRETRSDGPAPPCPRCKEPMQALRLGDTDTMECAECGGLWLDPPSLQKLCSQREHHSSVVSALAAHVPRATVGTESVRYIPCPRCKKLMNRTNFARSSGVILDVCKTDGVWLDRGELQRVLGFVEAGGLAKQRSREIEELANEQRRLAAMQRGEGERKYDSIDVGFTRRGKHGSSASSTALESVLLDIAGLFNSI
ncbi:MAG: zf-TFIIB domain-containing protein [Gemmatimonadota bacterium]